MGWASSWVSSSSYLPSRFLCPLTFQAVCNQTYQRRLYARYLSQVPDKGRCYSFLVSCENYLICKKWESSIDLICFPTLIIAKSKIGHTLFRNHIKLELVQRAMLPTMLMYLADCAFTTPNKRLQILEHHSSIWVPLREKKNFVKE